MIVIIAILEGAVNNFFSKKAVTDLNRGKKPGFQISCVAPWRPAQTE
jgi:hypothetical protein